MACSRSLDATPPATSPDASSPDASPPDASSPDTSPPDAPRPSTEGFPCGDAACNPATQFCAHSVDGLNQGSRLCYPYPVPSSCDGGATDCSCLPDGGLPFCYACRTVGTGPTGLELDCPGPIDYWPNSL